nr:sigma-70 family RNA polymerase sigma factor [Kitasatospora paracochleata]
MRRLVASVARGDRTAFPPLYRALAAPVHGVVLRTLRCPAQAEEVAQEVLLEVWRTAAAYRPDRGTVTTWALTIAHRRAVDRVRAVRAATDRELRLAHRDEPIHESVHASAADEAERILAGRRVQSALGRLGSPQRQPLVLAYYGGYTQSEIARLLDLPLGTVKTRMRDGLRRLRTALADERDE